MKLLPLPMAVVLLLVGAASCDEAQAPAPAASGVWQGSLTVECEDDIRRLEGVHRLTGNLTIRTAGLLRIDLLDLEEIDGQVLIDGCDGLEVLWLPKLVRIGGDLMVSDNPDLRDVDGLRTLRQLDGFLHLYGNPALGSLEGFSGLSRVGGSVHIWDNDVLETFAGLHNLAEIGGELCFSNDDALRDVSALSRLRRVRGHLYVFLDHELESLRGLHNIEVVEGTVFLGFKQGKQTFGAGALRDMGGLSSLRRIGKHLLIAYSEALVDLEGLSNLEELGGALIVYDNKALPSCAVEDLEQRLRHLGWTGQALVDENLPDECSNAEPQALADKPSVAIDLLLPEFERL